MEDWKAGRVNGKMNGWIVGSNRGYAEVQDPVHGSPSHFSLVKPLFQCDQGSTDQATPTTSNFSYEYRSKAPGAVGKAKSWSGGIVTSPSSGREPNYSSPDTGRALPVLRQ